MASLHTVSPSKIRSSLDALWEENANKNKMRASLFNIIFFTENSPREEYLRKIAYKLIEKFPARIFFVSTNNNAPDELTTSVAVLSTKQGNFDITCDLIEISASGAEEAKIPMLLLPHIIPDLPVFLLWGKNPSHNHTLCEELKQFATRIIFDSESAEDLSSFAQSVLQLEKAFSCEVADLNWGRLESWRSLCSGIFSDPDRLSKLRSAQSLSITYNSHETPFFCHTKIQSIYLQAWIASCLKWHPKEFHESLRLFSYHNHDTTVEVSLQEVDHASLPPGMITSLTITTKEGDHFLFERDLKATHQITFSHSSQNQCSLPTLIQVSKGESGQSLIKEICHKGTSQHYIDTLKTIATGGLL